MEEVRFQETLVSIIYGKNGRSKEGTTNGVDMKPQNQLRRMYIQNLNDNVADGLYSKGLFNAFRKTMAWAS